MLNQAQNSIFTNAVNSIAKQLGRPLLYGANGKPLRLSAEYTFGRQAAKRTGSMKEWIPRKLGTRFAEAMERERIVERSVDITNNDPHAAGVVDTFAANVVGPGLTPHPMLNADELGLEKDVVRKIQAQEKSIYKKWAPFADAALRMDFGAIQYLAMRNTLQYGEYLILAHMLKDPIRPYSLACQAINPLRLRTPIDKRNIPRIRDGIELNDFGEPVAYWIKKANLNSIMPLSDTSKNFVRIPTRAGHRWKVLHGFFTNEPEQYRGMPILAPGLKMFRDLNDYLDAELVSNIVTAAFALFIETGGGLDPTILANQMANMSEYRMSGDGDLEKIRYQELVPGLIMYGEPGEKPHPIAASRPGQTFEPFTKIIKKALAMSVNIPYPVLFKDVDGVNYAGFRSAMLEAWRIFSAYRIWLGRGFAQKIYTMLMEEAFLMGDLQIANFYDDMLGYTNCEWRGYPKGDIEPVKAAQADTILIQNNLKTRAEAISERGGDLQTTFDGLEEEQQMMEERNLTDNPIEGAVNNNDGED